jgi:hypothetical protein
MEQQLSILLERINEVLQGSPLGQKIAKYPVTTTIMTLSLVFHLACLVGNEETVISALAVSPSATLMAGKFWTIITSSLVENNSTKFFLFGLFVALSAYQLESEWGSLPLAKHIAVSICASSLASALAFIAVYMSTLNDEIFFSHVYGLGGLVVSLFVGMVKVRSRIQTSGLDAAAAGENTKISAKTPEKIFTVPAIVAYSLLGLKFPLHDALLVVFSFFVAVANLRTEEFSYAVFLPDFASSTKKGQGALELPLPIHALPQTPDPTKERFRARGFRLLDKKLAELEAAPEIPLDGGDKLDESDKA